MSAVSNLPLFPRFFSNTLVETDPVGGPEQPDYLNTVILGRSRLAPQTLLDRLHHKLGGRGPVQMLDELRDRGRPATS